MTIRYAGVPIEPPHGSLEVLRRYWHGHRIGEFDFAGYNVSDTDHLPLPPPPRVEPPAVGRLLWPTGAARWATCHLIATGEQVIALRTALGAGAGALAFDDGRIPPIPGAGGGGGTQMWMLPPRPIAQRGGEPSGVTQNLSELYLLTLVDERWWWWQAPGLQTSPDTWDGLIADLLGLVGVTPVVQDPAPAAYGVPWAGRWDRVGKPVPLLIDAACKTVGLSLVRGLDGAVAVQNSARAAASDAASWALWNTECLAGGQLAAADAARMLPAAVSVVFPGEPPLVVTAALAAGTAGQVGRLVADKPATDPTGGHAAYAAQAAADYYAWQATSRTDATLRGFLNYVPAGVHDAIEYTHAPDQLATRVLRLTWTDHFEEGGPAPALFFPGEVTGAWDPTTGYPWRRLTEDVVDPPSFVVAAPGKAGDQLVEVTGRTDLLPGTRVLVWRNPDGAGWGCQRHLTPVGCGLRHDPATDAYYVDPNDFAGSCLLVDNSNPLCPILYVNPACVSGSGFTVACGLSWAGAVLSVKPADLVGAPEVTSLVVVPSEGACAVGVDLDVAFEQDWVRHAITFFGRVAGGKLRLCYTIYVDTDQYNVAGLYLNHVIGDGANVCREVDICDPACCADCTISFAVSVDSSSITLGTATTLTFDTLSGCTGPYTVTVSWGDGTVETFTGAAAGNTHTHTYAAVGTYHITADAYDECGYAAAAADVTVNVSAAGFTCAGAPSSITYTTSTSGTCSPGIPSSGSGSGGPNWAFGGTTSCGTAGPPQGWEVQITCSGDALTYSVFDGNTYTGAVVITQVSPLIANFSYTALAGSCCVGQTVTVTING